jgi:hypothetical protein
MELLNGKFVLRNDGLCRRQSKLEEKKEIKLIDDENL